MEKAAALSKKFLLSYRKLPDKKPYIEVLTAVLSVPVLITVIMLNLNNLNSQKKESTESNAKVKEQTVYVPIESKTLPKKTTNNQPLADNPATSPEPTAHSSISACKTEIGPVAITSPEESETITDNPVSINVDYETGEYCAVVWSHRINGGSWSEYDDKSIALYNLPKGKIKLEIRVKSIASGGEKILTRNFIYNGNSQALTPSPDTQTSNTSSGSAN
jgi:hypothetical protein